MYGYAGLQNGYVGLCKVMYGYAALYRSMWGYVWLCMAMYVYVSEWVKTLFTHGNFIK